MRWRALGLIQLLVLLAHLSASPFGLLHVEWPTAGGERDFVGAQSIHETTAFTAEGRASLKAFALTARLETVPQDPPTPHLLESALATRRHTQDLNGFRLRVSERPPPSRL